MSRYVLTAEAQQDIRQIRDHLLQEAGVRVTRRVMASLGAAFRSLVRTPGQGHRRGDLTLREELRFWVVFSYLVVYRIDRRPLTIIAVVHAKRNFKEMLASR